MFRGLLVIASLLLSAGAMAQAPQPRIAPSAAAKAALARGDTAAGLELLWTEIGACERAHPRDPICLDLRLAAAEAALAIGHRATESNAFSALLLTKTPLERLRALRLMLAGRNLTGDFSAPDDHFVKEALETIAANPDIDPVLVAQTRSAMAAALDGLGRYGEAQAMHRQVIAGLRPHRAAMPAAYAGALGALARNLDGLGRNIEAEPLWREAIATAQGRGGGTATDYYRGLGANLLERGRYRDAEPLLRLAVAEYRLRVDLPGARAGLATSLSDLGACLDMLGRAVDATPLYEEAAALSKVGDSLTSQFKGRNWLRWARNAYIRRQLESALFAVDAAIIFLKSNAAPDHPDLARAYQLRGFILETARRPDEAEAMYRQARAMWTRTLRFGHPDRVIGDATLALYLTRQGRDDGEARAVSLEAQRGILDHIAAMPSFEGEAQAAIRQYSPLFRGQVLTCWRLAHAGGAGADQRATGTP